MKKTLITMLLFSTAALFGGCNDNEAREYSKRLADVLRTYKLEVNKKIEAEKKSYRKLAAVYAYAKQSDVTQGLQTERYRRASSLADSLMQGGKPSLSEIQRLIGENAKADFDAMRSVYEAEIDDQASYLTGLENLELQVQSIDALINALDEMAEPKSKISQLKDLADFAAAVKAQLDTLACEDFARGIKCLEKEKGQATTEARKKELAEEIAMLTKQMETGKCDMNLLTTAKCPAKP